jgi:ElaA protein
MINWVCKKFEDLSVNELYAVLQLRNEVFVVEQDCVYMDTDNKDQRSYHFMGWENEKLAAYTRIIPPGIVFTESSIGRVVTSPSMRRKGLGRELMKRSIEQARSLFGEHSIRIGAQVYLTTFYKSLGFNIDGNKYLEDGIEHVEMVRTY